ncbi:MAG: MFS transporter [Pseudomonadota bacterium]
MFNIILLGITSLLTDISSEMVYPILPVFLVTVLGASPAILGLIEGIAESLASLLKVFSGYFSDKIKQRRPFAIFGYSASCFGKLFLYVANSWGIVLLARVVDRFGKGIRTAPRDALIGDSSKDGARGASFGLHRAMDTFGAVIGISIAYFLLKPPEANMRRVFFFSLIPALLGVIFLFFVREKRTGKAVIREKEKISLRWSALDKRLKLFFAFTFIFTLGNSSNQFLLLRAKNLGGSIPQVILFYLAYNIVYALTTYPVSRISDRVGRKTIIVCGYFFYGIVYLAFALCGSISLLWILFGLYGLYSAFTEGVEKALVVDLAQANVRATAIGMHATLVGLGLFPASLLAGLLWKFLGASAPFYFGSFMGFVSCVGFWFVLKGV